MGDELCSDRLPARSADLRESQRPLWPETPANPGRATLRSLLRRHCAGQRVSQFCDVANRWGNGHRSCFQSFSHVHRGNFACRGARQVSLAKSAHHRYWNSAGPVRELADRPACAHRCFRDGDSELMEWPDSVALDVWRHRGTLSAIFARNADSAGEPALASPEWPARESRTHPRSP